MSWHEPGPALREYDAFVGAADGCVTRCLADAAIDELLGEVARLKSAGSALEKAVRGYFGF